MAATVSSPWSKPGAWALDAEEHEAELQQQDQQPQQPEESAADFPSLAAAAADAKTAKKKKKKGTTISLSALQSGAYAKPDFNPVSLPKGPRERSAEELDSMRNGGGGFRSYGDSSNSRWGREAGGGRDSNSRGYGGRDSSREREVREPLGPSRADEADDWSKGKRSSPMGGGGDGFERRGRDRSSPMFESHSKADESDSWVSNKPIPASVEPRRFGGGFERRGGGGGSSFDSLSRDRNNANGGSADSETWGRRREAPPSNMNGGSAADSETWGRKREESNGTGTVASSRPKLVLNPRTAPVSNGSGGESVAKPKGSNPFGNARPREEVLAGKGKDWKEIDEKLESMKMKGEDDKGERGEKGSSRWSFGRVGSDEVVEKSWRKAESVDSTSRPASAESVENGHDDPAELEPAHLDEHPTENGEEN